MQSSRHIREGHARPNNSPQSSILKHSVHTSSSKMSTISAPLFSVHHSPLFHSPLSPFHYNVQVSKSMSNSSGSQNQSPNFIHRTSQWRHVPNQQRGISNQSSSQRRELRNKALLQRVQDRRHNARDQTRSEQILRSNMLAEQREWELAQEMEAARWAAKEEDEMYIQSDVELEEYLRREEEELQSRAEQAMQTRTANQNGGEFGNEDDDDFDMLVLEAVEEFERSQQDGQRDMDLT